MAREYWYQKQLRILQTVLREPDIVNYNAKSVVDYMNSVDANCIVVNAGGVIDFFKNNLALSRVNAFLNKENLLGDLVEECHGNDIKVLVRIDFRGVEDLRYNLQPDWFALDASGNPMIGWEKIYKPCYNSIYANDHAIEYIDTMMNEYDIDGIWENCVGFHSGPCYCKRCKDTYKADTGKEIPVGDDYASNVFSEYRTWKAKCGDAHIQRIRDTVKRHGEDKAYCAEIFGMFHASNVLNSGIDLYNAKRHFDFLVSPAFLDGSANISRKYDDLTYAASSIRFLKSIAPEKQSVLLYGNNGTKWRYVKAPKQETKIWLWEAASAGGSFWNCMFNGQHPGATIDTRNAYLEQNVYTYLKENEQILHGQIPVKDVGIFYSKPSRDTFGDDDEEKDQYGVFMKGCIRIMESFHLQYNFIPDLNFTSESIAQLKSLVIPNGACLSNMQIETIKDFVKNGGGLVASFETSLYDEQGYRRENFGLVDLFGCDYSDIKIDTSSDCYQLVRNQHPVLDSMDINRTKMIMNEGETLLCNLSSKYSATMVCSYVPKIYNQPPEFAWIPKTETSYPTIVVNHYGKGRVVYFANQTDKLCYTNGHEDFLQTYFNAIQWVSHDSFSIKTNAPESVHITLTCDGEKQSLFVLSFVNSTSGTVRPIRDLVPVYGLSTEVYLGNHKLRQFSVLKQDGVITVDTKKEGGEIVIQVLIERLQEFASVSLCIE